MHYIIFKFIHNSYSIIKTSDEIMTSFGVFLTSGGLGVSYAGFLIDPNSIDDGGGDYCSSKKIGANLIVYYEDDHTGKEIEIYKLKCLTLYKILFEYKRIKNLKIPSFTITQQDERYAIKAEGLEEVIIDPNDGQLYNDSVPRLVLRLTSHSLHVDTPNQGNLYLLYELLCDAQENEWITQLVSWVEDIHDGEIEHGGICVIKRGNNFLYLRPVIRVQSSMPQDLLLYIHTFRDFIRVWQRYIIERPDAITLVLLGATLRFFEGEPGRM